MMNAITYENDSVFGRSTTIIIEGGYGYVMVSAFGKDRQVVIHDLNVHKNVRRRGIGRELLRLAIEAAERMDADSVLIAARADSWQQRWYEREGFKAVGIADAYPTQMILDKPL